MKAKLHLFFLLLIALGGCSPSAAEKDEATNVAQVSLAPSTPSPFMVTDTRSVTLTSSPAITALPTVEQTATPLPPPTYQPIMWRTPTADISHLQGVQNVYRNIGIGFSFEYPAVYDVEPYKDCGVKERRKDEALVLTLGFQSDLVVKDIDGLSFDEYVEPLMARFQEPDKTWLLESQNYHTINSDEALTIEYAVGSPESGYRGGWTATFLKHGTYMFTFNFLHGERCDIPDIEVDEFKAYEHMIASLHFDD